MSLRVWSKNMELAGKNSKSPVIHKIYSAVLTWIYDTKYRGGCHDTSAAMYILFRESGVNCSLCIGEVATGGKFFDHSWVEISGEVYDAAACMPLAGGTVHPPVFGSIDLDLGIKTSLGYGQSSPVGLDSIGQWVADVDLLSYSQGHKFNPDKLWHLTKELGKLAGIKVNIGKIKDNYGAIYRELRSQGESMNRS